MIKDPCRSRGLIRVCYWEQSKRKENRKGVMVDAEQGGLTDTSSRAGGYSTAHWRVGHPIISWKGLWRTILPPCCSSHSRFGFTDGWSHNNHFTIFPLHVSDDLG